MVERRRALVKRAIRARAAFTFVEFLVAVGIIAILIAIVIPYLLRAREVARRTQCAANIGQIGRALMEYAKESGPKFPFPQVVYDSVRKPEGYVAFTGPDDPDPFAKNSAVKANDVTASLWLLIRRGYITDPSVFTCPSTSDEPDRLTNAAGAAVPATMRGNFRHPENLSYSYACPFTDAFGFVFTSDRINAEAALLADKNPGFETDGIRVKGPTLDAPPFELANGNSPNHQHAGQNVLFGDGHVEFEATPYCGVAHDNIYTAVAAHRLDAEHPPLDVPGYLGRDVGPAYKDDSYLVPTAVDKGPG
jgi:prepilin-type processing-associated H-X9-DG protein